MTKTRPRKMATKGLDIPRLEAEYRAFNAQRPRPLRECPSCRFPTLEGDWGAIREDICAMCDGRWLDGLMERIVRRHGREALVRALTELAGE